MKINKGTAAALVVLVLGIAALAAWGDQLGMSEGSLHWVQGAAGAVGALVMALLPKLFADKDGDGIPDIVQRGSMLLVVWLGLGVIASGCGASALTAQARAATIVGVGLGGAGQEIHDERAAALDACHDVDCETATASAWAPAVAAYESARAALSTWIEALDVARAAGADDGDVLGALFVAVTRLARGWNALAEALRGVGVPLPDLPPAVVALLGGASS